MVNKSPRAESFRNAAWRIAALALAPAVGLGIARFAYALVLPDMRADLGWSFAEAGWMNSANAAGYLLGALAAAFAIGRFGMARVIVIGVGTCVLSLLLSAVVRDIPGLSLVRLIAGLGGAFAFVAGGVAAAEIAARHEGRAAFLIGLFYAGPGVGILVSGIAAPTLLAVYGAGSWP